MIKAALTIGVVILILAICYKYRNEIKSRITGAVETVTA